MENSNIYLPPAKEPEVGSFAVSEATKAERTFITNGSNQYEDLFRGAIEQSGLPFHIVRPAFDCHDHLLSCFAVWSDVPHRLLDPYAWGVYDQIVSEGLQAAFNQMVQDAEKKS